MQDNISCVITEQRDSFGRSTGYTYAKNGLVQQTVSTGYGDDGRISSAGFLHGSEAKNFGYTYLAGTNLLQVLTKPNGMTLTQTYEASRDLLTSMAYHRGTTLVAQREYTHDILGRPTARNTARQGKIVHDIFSHNTRSELVGATVNNKEYEYSYDNIGNRLTSMEEDESTIYATNALNQYTSVHENSENVFTPEFDADGNQTRIKTQTGIWEVIYNAENRPVSFTNATSGTVVTCAYDSMGRRSSKKVSVNGIVSLYQRYLYRGYLQIASIDLTRSHHPCLWLITWDPSQTFATRPLAIQKGGTWFTYGWNLSKNICEVFKSNGTIGVAYVYSPYGHIWSEGSISQPVCWSSEMYDEELALTYFNHRFFDSSVGRWISHDIIGENDSLNLYAYVKNSPIMQIDSLGMLSLSVSGDIKDSALTSRRSISGVGWALDFQVKKLGYDVSIEWEKDKTTIAGKLQASAEAGITGGIAHAFNFAGMRAWAMLGLRGYAAASFYGGISGIRECNQYFAKFSFGGKITLGAQLGAMMRIFYTYDEYTEVGLYGSASWSFDIEAYVQCGGSPFTCKGDVVINPMNTIDLSLNANLLLFEQSFSGKVSLNDNPKYSVPISLIDVASAIKSWLDK